MNSLSTENMANGSLENDPNKSADTESKDLQASKKKPKPLVLNGHSPGISRYGRIIKPKSPENAVDSLPKNSKIPKTSRQLSTTDDAEYVEENFYNAITEDIANDSCISTNIMEKESPTKIDNVDSKSTWTLGQLAWARVGNFPFWPCAVTLDPEAMIYHRTKSNGRYQSTQIHVHYFGDKGRRGWVTANYMMPFTSIGDFKKLAEEKEVEGKKKDPKYVAAFTIKNKIKSKWESAVEEAVQVQSMTNEARANMFAPATKVKKPKSAKILAFDENDKGHKKRQTDLEEHFIEGKGQFDEDRIDKRKQLNGDKDKFEKRKNQQNDKGEKRKHSGHMFEPESKRPRHQNAYYLEKTQHKLGLVDINSETPSASPTDDDEFPSTQGSLTKNGDNQERIFEVYYERNRDMLEDEHPDATEDDIKKYLRKTWNDMNSSFRQKYRQYITTENNLKSRESFSDQEEEQILESDLVKESKRVRAKEKEEATTPDTRKSRPYNLFKGMKQEKVCQICEKTGKLTRCRGPCYSYFHLSCVKPGEFSPKHSLYEKSSDSPNLEDLKVAKKDVIVDEEVNGKSEDVDDETFKCIDCLSGVAPACFICNEREGDRIRCSAMACGKHYHSVCLMTWPQSHWQGGRLTCPYHICHTCSSDNPQDNHFRSSSEKLVRCVRCPSSYHAAAACLPAGSVILTGSQIICPKHYKAPHPPLNATWCFLCTKGGSLICCDTCPTSFHLECLGINAPDGAFICEDCETGRLPLYGEVVWVKLGHYRWWPSRICFPHEIPEKVAAIPHSPGKFCVMFLGSNNYYWVHRGRAFLYQDGDANIKIPMGKKSIRDDVFRRAVKEASEIHQDLKLERAAAKDCGPRGLKPLPYVKLKVNKPVGNVKPAEVESMVACDCSEDWDNPCGPETDCLNRILLVECSPDICPAGPKCKNQCFARREYPSMEPFHTVERGWGLKTLEPIESGQFIIEYVGEVIDEAEYKRRLTRKKELKNENYYFLTIDNNRMIDAEPKGNLSRFMNHSCMPNCETQKWTVNGDTRIGLFALRNIEAGEELTFNYNLASDGETRKPCLCGAPNCSGFIGLKVQKQQQHLSVVQQKKIEKAEKVKRQRRSREIKCWNCGRKITTNDKNSYVSCAQKTCNKKYHKSCVDIDDPDLRFSCPWHHCADCGKRTSAHCSFCSTAFCQVHLNGNLFEYGDKLVCKQHENVDAQKSSTEEEKDYSDNDIGTDKEYSSTRSSSPITINRTTARESSPRVSIVEVLSSSEESEESQKEEEEEEEEEGNAADAANASKERKRFAAWRRKTFHRLSLRLQEEEEQADKLNNLTSSQLEAIIGGKLFM